LRRSRRRRRQRARGELAAPARSVAAADRGASRNLPSDGPDATLGRPVAMKTASNSSDNCDNEMLFSVLAAAHYNILPPGGRANWPGGLGQAGRLGRCRWAAAGRLAGMARIGSSARHGFVAQPGSATGTLPRRLALLCSALLHGRRRFPIHGSLPPRPPASAPAIIIYRRRRASSGTAPRHATWRLTEQCIAPSDRATGRGSGNITRADKCSPAHWTGNARGISSQQSPLCWN